LSRYCKSPETRQGHLLALGLVHYEEGLRWQQNLRGKRLAGKAPDTLVLLEHPPVITVGRSGGLENLLVPASGKARRTELRQREDQVLHLFPQLAALRQRLGGLLSGGERQMLALAAALVCKPELLLVDELSLGLAPVIVEDLAQRLLEIRKELGISIVIVEQSAAVALDIADHTYVMENGRIVLDGDSDRLRGHPDVQEFYLGLSTSGKRRSYRDVKQYRRSRRWYG